MDSWTQDLRLTARQLFQRPAFTLLAVGTLAVGMGVNAVAFTVVNSLLLRGFSSYAAPNLGRIVTTPQDADGGHASLAELQRFRDATEGSATVTAEGRLTMAWRRGSEAATAWILAVSPEYFSLVTPAVVAGHVDVSRGIAGRPTVVVGERFWRDTLGAPSLAGLTLRLNNADVDVSAVLSESFTGPGGMYSPDVWIPLDALELFRVSPALARRETRWLFVLAQPNSDVAMATIQGQIEAAAAVMAREWPDTIRGRGARYLPLGAASEEERGRAAALVLGVIGVILLLACFNVANLLLARAVERERDFSIRTALGASPRRLVRLVLTEGGVLAILAGVGALAVAWWTHDLVAAFAIPLEEPQHVDLTPDRTVVAYVVGLIALAAVLPGVWPALAAARIDGVRALGTSATQGGGRRTPLRRWLVGAQVAGATAFLSVGTLFVQSFSNVASTQVGFADDELLVAEMEPASHGYTVEHTARYLDALMARTRALPGVMDVTVADNAPFFIGRDSQEPVWPPTGTCEQDRCPQVPAFRVTAGYFRTLGIPLAAGRELAHPLDAPLAEVVVNDAFARQKWPEGNALGQMLRLGVDGQAFTIVGVTAPIRMRGLDRESPTVFLPLTVDTLERSLAVIVRTPRPEQQIRPFIEAARDVDARITMREVRTMTQRVAVQLWPYRTLGWVFGICAALALVLATTGLVGVVVHAVQRRTREIGVRMAVGATSRDIAREVLHDGWRLLGPGLAVGLTVAAASSQLVRSVFVGVNVLNPLVYVSVAVVLTAVVSVACLGPAWRASRVAPVTALRVD